MTRIVAALTVLAVTCVTAVTVRLSVNNADATSQNNGESFVESPVKPASVILQDKTGAVYEVPTAKRARLSIKRTAVVRLFEPIDAISVEATMAALNVILTFNDAAYIIINSPGGEVFEGSRLVNFIETSEKPIHTICVNICASMAAHIFEAGKKRYMTENAVLMFHPAAGGLRGTVPEMGSQLNHVERYTAKMDAKVAKRAGINPTEFSLMVLKNSWTDGEESLSLGLTDKVISLTIKD